MFSFVIPTYRPRYLENTIKSLQGLDYPSYHFEVVVVENPVQTDNVKSIMSNLPGHFKLVTCPTMGANAARNYGIKEAKYDNIILTDDDCKIPSHYLSRLSDTISKFKASMVGGPLICEFLYPKPRWITKGFLANLSEINFAPNIDTPFDINLIKAGYLVSANLFFTRELYNRIGPFEEEHGYIGNGLFANDEVRFINRARKGVVLYDNQLAVKHIIGPERCNLEYFIQRKYSQGYVDAVLFLENSSVIDVYNNQLKWHMLTSFNHTEIAQVRNTIQDEEVTRQWIRAKTITDTAYQLGMIHKLEGKDKCENVCALLMDEAELNIFSRP